mgnify:CR=1 FL=1
MLAVTSIASHAGRPSDSIIDTKPSVTEAESPRNQILASYDLSVSNGTVCVTDWAEVREGPNGPQIDWSDDIQDFLSANKATTETWDILNVLLFEHYRSGLDEFPYDLLGAA